MALIRFDQISLITASTLDVSTNDPPVSRSSWLVLRRAVAVLLMVTRVVALMALLGVAVVTKVTGVVVMMVPLLLGVVVGITRVIMTIMKVAYTYGNIVILCPKSFKCIDPQFPKVSSAGIVVLSLQSGI